MTFNLSSLLRCELKPSTTSVRPALANLLTPVLRQSTIAVATTLNRSDLALRRANFTFELGFVSVCFSMTRWACFRPSDVRPGYGPVSIGFLHLSGFAVATHDCNH